MNDFGHEEDELVEPQTYGERIQGLRAQGTMLDTVLVDQWRQENLDAGPLAKANPRKPIRHSWSGKCARQIAYYMLGIETPPMDRAGTWVTRLGTEVHKMWQDSIEARLGDHPTTEVAFEVPVETDVSSGHLDLALTWLEQMDFADLSEGVKRSAVSELKTINGFGYKMVVKNGPRWSHVVQASVNGVAYGADRAYVVYLPMEANRQVDPRLAVGATFEIPPRLMRETGEAELDRWRRIVQTVRAGKLPPRSIEDDQVPVGSLVEDPMTGKLDTKGRTWQCGYCPFVQQCMADGKGLQHAPWIQRVEDLWA